MAACQRSILATLVRYYVSAAVLGAFVARLVDTHHVRVWLLSCAGACELFGVLLVAAPELEPIFQHAREDLAAGWRRTAPLRRRVAARVRQLLGRPKHHVVLVGEAVGTSDAAGSLTARARVSPDASLAAKVDFLMRRYEETQTRLEEIGAKLESLPGEWRRDIDEVSATLREEHAEAIRKVRDQRLTERLLGLFLLVIGVVLNTAGNLI
jgi:hypothetical protein